MKNPLTIKIAVGLALILFLVSALVVIGFDINKKISQITDLRQKISSRSQIVKNLSLLRFDFNKFEASKNILEGLLINKDKLIEFLKDLSALNSQTNVSFSSSFTGEELDDNGLGHFNLAMVGDAGFDNFIKFVKYLENGNFFLQFDNLDIAGKDNNFKISLNGKIFYYVYKF
ncbi:type 4a pilus biogenesis protein PilO [Candidatus Wolfebacteria bacterium]|nr:type 4a pilus biogenesis protein PilO [Candidatus Wolfebacteria bacterium]